MCVLDPWLRGQNNLKEFGPSEFGINEYARLYIKNTQVVQHMRSLIKPNI